MQPTAAKQCMWDVGDISVEGVRTQNVNFESFLIDGLSLTNTGVDMDDWPHIRFRYVDGGGMDRVNMRNGSTLARIGRGRLEWSSANQQSLNIEIRNFYVRNPQFFGVECHGHRGCRIHHGRIVGGARAEPTNSAGLRSVKGRGTIFDHVLIEGLGRSIIGGGTEDDLQQDILFDQIVALDPTYGSCIDFGGPVRDITFNSIRCRGNGPSQTAVARLGLLSGINVRVLNSWFEATSADSTDCLRLDNVTSDGEVRGCTMRNRLTSPTGGAVNGLRVVGVGGILHVSNNVFDLAWNNAAARAMYNVSPIGGSQATYQGNSVYKAANGVVVSGTWSDGTGNASFNRY
jgi:hypothetical protein